MFGFITVSATRLWIECIPTTKRGMTAYYATAMAIGFFITFSSGMIFGNDFIAKWWFMFLLAPGIITFSRMIIMIIFFRFESPVFIYDMVMKYKQQSEDSLLDNTKLEEKIANLKSQAEKTLSYFNENKNNIYYEKRLIKENVNLGYKKGESSIVSLVKTNICSRDRIYSFLCIVFLNLYAPFTGQVFIESYTTRVFTKFMNAEFAKNVNFYSGFAVILGSITGPLIIQRMKRITFMYGNLILAMVSMGFMAVGMYFKLKIVVFVSNVGYFFFYNVFMGIAFVYPHEVSQPFVVGIGFSVNFGFRAIVAKIFPLIYENFPIYCTPAYMFMMGVVTFIIMRPLMLETKDKSIQAIESDYAK